MVHFRKHPGYGHAVSTPEDFEIGIPRSFEWLTGSVPGLADGVSTRAKPDGVWVEVKGGDLPVPLVVRIDQTPSGRFIITGMLIGRDEHRELTWTTLRQIKPSSIISTIFAGWDPRFPEKLVDDTVHRQAFPWELPTSEELEAVGGEAFFLDPALPPGDAEAQQLDRAGREAARALRAYEIWRMTGGAQGATTPAEEVTRPRASVATNLTEFADVYRRNFASDPRRATTATAKQLHISRATAIRRIAECREIGLIPPKEQDRE